jgi:hypothetical protein
MKPFYIDYPQEKIAEYQHSYRCAYCKIPTTIIFGLLQNHSPDCQYRLDQSKWTQMAASLKPEHKPFDEPHTDEVD